MTVTVPLMMKWQIHVAQLIPVACGDSDLGYALAEKLYSTVLGDE